MSSKKSRFIFSVLLVMIVSCIAILVAPIAGYAQEVDPKFNPSRTECNSVPNNTSSTFQLFRGFDRVTIGSNDRISFGQTELDVVITTQGSTRITGVRYCVLGISGTYRKNQRGKRVLRYTYAYVWTPPIAVTKTAKNTYIAERPLAGNNAYLYGGKGASLFDYYEEHIAVFIEAQGTGKSKLSVKPV